MSAESAITGIQLIEQNTGDGIARYPISDDETVVFPHELGCDCIDFTCHRFCDFCWWSCGRRPWRPS